MKYLIIIFTLVAFSVNAQIKEVKEKPVTVYDTTYQSDARLNFLIQTVMPAIYREFGEEMARQKVNGEVTKEKETEKFVQELNAAVQKYAKSFQIVTPVTIEPQAIIDEYNQLNEKIQALQNDPEIKHIQAIREYQNIQERADKLNSYARQIEAQKQVPVSK